VEIVGIFRTYLENFDEKLPRELQNYPKPKWLSMRPSKEGTEISVKTLITIESDIRDRITIDTTQFD